MLLKWLVRPRVKAFLVVYIVFAANAEQCTCINQCKTVTYSSDVSAARFSVSDILVGLRYKLDSSAKYDFHDALETAARVNEGNMHETVQLMLDVLQKHDLLGSKIRFSVTSSKTSLRTILLTFIEFILTMLSTTSGHWLERTSPK